MCRRFPFLPYAALDPILWCFGANAGSSHDPVAIVEEVKEGTCMMRETRATQPHPLHKHDTLMATDEVQCQPNLSAKCKYNETGGVFILSGTWQPVGSPGPRPPASDKPRPPAYTRPAFNMPTNDENSNKTWMAERGTVQLAEFGPTPKIGFDLEEELNEGVSLKLAFGTHAPSWWIHLEPEKATGADDVEMLLIYPIDSKSSIKLYQNPGDKHPYAMLAPENGPLDSSNKSFKNGFWGVKVGGKAAWVNANSVQVQSAGPNAKTEVRQFGCSGVKGTRATCRIPDVRTAIACRPGNNGCKD
jgi:hypothetical protein